MSSINEYVDALVRSERFRSHVAGRHRIQGRPAQLTDFPSDLSASGRGILEHLGLSGLYSHQRDAFAAISNGGHTVVATPTASGKTLIYNLPVFEAVARNCGARALFIYPLKALAQDQLTTFSRWAKWAAAPAPTAAIYDGDTNAYQRKKIRLNPPNVIMTNPEMVHMALLAHHEQWQVFFSHLTYVVIDEVHTYRGMLGAHMAQTMRRLRRICRHYGARPTFIFTSATLADPGHLAGRLIDAPVQTITQSGAPQGDRHIVLIDPANSAAQAAILLLKAALARQLRTIVYTQSRRMAELIAVWAQQRSGRWQGKISAYRAGLMPHDRRDIETRLKDGNLLAVVSTSALELGIDIGGLDLCILVGYPGSMMSTWQRGGRAGRQGQPSGLIMIAAENALDRYFIDNPQAFWSGKAESAVINPFNRVALMAHLECAAAEHPLAADEPCLQHPEVSAALEALVHNGVLRRTADGTRLHARRRRPHLSVHLRGNGKKFRILDASTGEPIGDIDAHRLYREAHCGAIYLQQGQTYVVSSVEPDVRLVRMRPAVLDYYTRVRSDTDVVVVQVQDSKVVGCTGVHIGTLKVTDHITAYDRIRTRDGETLMQVPLDVPPLTFETQGIWFDIPSDVCRRIADLGFDLMGALHAAEHAAISMMPLFVLADRNDLGGLSTSFHCQTGRAAIFVYDGVPGGAGFCEQAFARAAALLRDTQSTVRRCACDQGCPACVHSPKCGSGNHPIDKAGAVSLLDLLQLPPSGRLKNMASTPPAPAGPTPPAHRRPVLHFGVFDLETQLSAQQVGGWHKAHRMRVSCGIVYDSRRDRFVVYDEDRITGLIDHLRQVELVIGFNSKRFDYNVLRGYSDFDFRQLPSLDLLERVSNLLGHRLSLDHLAEATLGVCKSGCGLDALRWWREGRWAEIVEYCRMDVCLTRDLYLFARQNGYLIYRDRQGGKFRIPFDVAV